MLSAALQLQSSLARAGKPAELPAIRAIFLRTGVEKAPSVVSASEDGGSDLDSPVPELKEVLEQVLDEFEDELGDRPEAPYQNAYGDTIGGKHGYETASQLAKLRHAALLQLPATSNADNA